MFYPCIFIDILELPILEGDPSFARNLKHLYSACLNKDSVFDDTAGKKHLSVLIAPDSPNAHLKYENKDKNKSGRRQLRVHLKFISRRGTDNSMARY